MDHRHGRSPARPAWLPGLLILGAGLLLTACQTVSQAVYQAKSAELAVAQEKLAAASTESDRLAADLAATQTRLAELDKHDQAQTARVRELEENINRLENLLNDLQALQLDRMMPKPEAAMVLSTGSDQAVTPVVLENSVADTVPAHPASGPALPITLETSAATPVAPAAGDQAENSATATIDASPAPLPALDTGIPPATDLTQASAKTVSSGRLGGGLGHDLLTRVERTRLRGTPLFAERDSANGRYYYYHQDAWYDQPGVFLEFSRPLGGKYSARLLIQIPDNQATSLDTECTALLADSPLGPTLEARPLDDGSRIYQFLVLDYDAALAASLRQALDSGTLSFSVAHAGGGSSPVFTPNLAMRQALREMMEAREDLR